jgi:hypothetical protein
MKKFYLTFKVVKKSLLFLFFGFTVSTTGANNNYSTTGLLSGYEPLFCSPDQMAKDTIIKRNGEKIICTVKEIGTAEIKFVREEFKPDLLFSIEKKEIDRIIYSDGQMQKFEAETGLHENIERNSDELFQIQKKNILKMDVLSPIANTTSLTYEKCLKPGRSLEFSLGVVGLGLSEKHDNSSGILFRGGYKLMRNPDFYLRGMRYAHIMKGPYIKFEFDFASYSLESYKDIFEERKNYTLTKWALLVVFGNQWVFNDNFTVDLYYGIGPGKNNLDHLDWSYPYGFTTLGKDFPLAFSFGLRCGFLI